MINFKRLLNSFRYASAGFRFAFRNDQNLIIHIAIAFIVILFGLLFRMSRFEIITLSTMIVLVLVAEMINTSIEKIVDLITTEYHQSAKIAKDVSSAMVLLTAIGASAVGFIIFIPYIFDFISF